MHNISDLSCQHWNLKGFFPLEAGLSGFTELSVRHIVDSFFDRQYFTFVSDSQNLVLLSHLYILNSHSIQHI